MQPDRKRKHEDDDSQDLDYQEERPTKKPKYASDDSSDGGDDDSSDNGGGGDGDGDDGSDGSDGGDGDDGSDGSDSSGEDGESAAHVCIQKFLQYVRQYLTANGAAVHEAYDSGAGWEIWLHVELLRFIKAAGETAIVREPDSYQGRLRADFAVGWGLPPKAARIPIEIKCETLRESAQTFSNRVNKDMAKVEQLDTAALVLAISISTDAKPLVHGEFSVGIPATDGTITMHYTFSEPS